MNNNDNKDLFDMYGVKHENLDNTQPTIDNNVTEVNNNNNISTQANSEVVDNNETKLVSDNIINESNTNNTNSDVLVEKQEIKPIPDNIINEPTINNSNNLNSEKDELLKLYIGPNYESIVNGSYSYCTMLLGLYYLYYRKQYSQAYMLLLVQAGIILAYDFFLEGLWYILLFSYLIICFILGASFKKNYVAKAKEKITEINKQNLSLDEKKEIIKKTGGVDNKVYILFISISIIAYISSIITLKYLIPSTDLEFHFPEEFKQNTTTNTTEYKIGKYEYYDLIVNHRTSDNVCNYKAVVNNEYLGTDKEKTITKYLEDKYSLENITLEKTNYEDKEFFHYYDEKEKKDYYIHLSDKYFSEINVTYVKDDNKKCREYTEYILNHTIKIK